MPSVASEASAIGASHAALRAHKGATKAARDSGGQFETLLDNGATSDVNIAPPPDPSSARPARSARRDGDSDPTVQRATEPKKGASKETSKNAGKDASNTDGDDSGDVDDDATTTIPLDSKLAAGLDATMATDTTDTTGADALAATIVAAVPADVPQPTAAAAPTNIPAVVVPVPTATDAPPADPSAAAAEPQSVAPVAPATAGGVTPEPSPPASTTPSAAPALPATEAADAAVTAEPQIAPKLEASKRTDDAHPGLPANALSTRKAGADAEPVVQSTDGETPPSERPSESLDGAPHKVSGRELETSAEAPKPAHHEAKPETVAQQHDDTATAAKTLADPLQLLSLQPHPLRAEGATLPAHAAASHDASAAPSMAVPVSGLAVEIAARVQDGKNRFEIRLDPPDLGRIDVRLDVDRAGNVTSRLVVDRAETLDVLRRDAHQLERALEQAGLKTGDNSLQFSLRDQSSAGTDRNNRDGALPNSAQVIVPDDDLSTVEATRGYGRWFGLGAGVDIRV